MSERFWSEANVEPKRGFRWYMSLTGPGDKLQTYAIKTVKKPSFAVTEVPHQFIAHTFYYPGRVTWNTIDVTFVDPGGDQDQSSVLVNMLHNSGYKLPKTEQDAYTSLSKDGFRVAVGTPIITQVDAAGADIEAWTLVNSFFTSVDFGQLDYSTEELVINSVTIRYDYATFEVKGGGGPASLLI